MLVYQSTNHVNKAGFYTDISCLSNHSSSVFLRTRFYYKSVLLYLISVLESQYLASNTVAHYYIHNGGPLPADLQPG